MSPPLPRLDPLLHQSARTQLVAYLAARGEASFSELKCVMAVTDGNLGAHLAKLMDAGYLRATEDSGGGRSLTVYTLTAEGRAALDAYVRNLSALLALGAGQDADGLAAAFQAGKT